MASMSLAVSVTTVFDKGVTNAAVMKTFTKAIKVSLHRCNTGTLHGKDH